MATYTTDLTTLVDFDGTVLSVEEPTTGYTAGRSPVNDDTDFAIQGSSHGSLTQNATGLGGMLATGSSFSWTSGDYMFGWIIWLAPLTIENKANGGLVMLLGSALGTYNVYNVGGNDYGAYPYGGWQNFVVNPEGTTYNNYGTPTSYHYVGCGANCHTKVSKGNPLGMDAFRYGRGEMRVAGTGATFTGMATANDNTSNRWGLFQSIEGGYKFKGLMILGYGGSTTFDDSSKSIVVDVTPHVDSDFNAIEIRNSSSVVDWTSISITQLGVGTTYATSSQCSFEAVDNATLTKESCVFIDMSTFIYQSNSTLNNTTYRRCGLVTQGSASFNSCTFDNPSGTIAITADDIALIDSCTFNSDGTGYAVDLGNITTTQSLDWKNYETGYVTGTAASDVGVTPTGNETIICNVSNGETLTISVASGASTPSVANSGTGQVNVEAGLLPLVVTVKDATTGLGIPDARIILQREDTKATIISGETNSSGIYSESVAASYNGVDYVGWTRQMDLIGTDYTPKDFSGTISSAGASINVSLEPL